MNWQEAMTRGWYNPADEGLYVGKLRVPCLQQVRPIPNPPNSPPSPHPPNSSPGGTMYSGPAPPARAPAAVGPPSEADAGKMWREALEILQQQQSQSVQVCPLKPTPFLSYSSAELVCLTTY